jgi:Cu(I)/Ag(I) efflux system membrane fusion protein
MAKDKTDEAPQSREGATTSWFGSPRTSAAVAAAVILAFFGGYLLRGAPSGEPAAPHDHAAHEGATSYICSMNNTHHPPVVKDGPGTCDYCGMALIPVAADGVQLGPRQIKLSEEAVRLARIRSAPVTRKFVDAEVRMLGKVVYDETRVAHITARVGGRIDDLYADYTGVPVKKGEHLFQIYSPEILAAENELLQALNAQRELAASASMRVKGTAAATVAASREKLRLWGLSKKQIEDVEAGGVARDHITINSPMDGVVVEKRAVEGSYVKTGTVVYVVADLSRVWVMLDAYEADIARLAYAQAVSFTTEAFPGEAFEGRISFIDPVVDPRTRTVGVRVNLPNESGRLMPGMFVRGTVRARLTSTGAVVDPDLTGKWVSPMHPEIVKDEPGTCDVCGMQLVPAESLGYATKADASPPLVVPVTAPPLTGKRSLVYVDVGGGIFEGKTVVLGPRAGDYYMVREGLKEGERVVVNGNFKIDSAIQILGKPSLMGDGSSPAGHGHGHSGSETRGSAAGGHDGHAEAQPRLVVPADFAAALDEVYEKYFALQTALSRDEFDASRRAAGDLLRAVGNVDASDLAGDARDVWTKASDLLTSGTRTAAGAANVVALREAFQSVSNALIDVALRLGTGSRAAVFRVHCPMAFNDTGGDWLAEQKTVENPYFGSQMFKCGLVKDTITSGGKH